MSARVILPTGNLHIDACLSPSLYPTLEQYVYEYTKQYRGSISAEHGLGLLKHKYLFFFNTFFFVYLFHNCRKLPTILKFFLFLIGLHLYLSINYLLIHQDTCTTASHPQPSRLCGPSRTRLILMSS